MPPQPPVCLTPAHLSGPPHIHLSSGGGGRRGRTSQLFTHPGLKQAEPHLLRALPHWTSVDAQRKAPKAGSENLLPQDSGSVPPQLRILDLLGPHVISSSFI